MLLTKEVEVKLNNAIIKYYEDKGYEIPKHINKNGRSQVKRGTVILVKIEDLSHGSNVEVKCLCDGCGKNYNIPYYKYIKHNHDGKTYCKECCTKYLLTGENHWNWDKNKTDEERIKGRKYPEYTDFVKRVLARDEYKCVVCRERASDVHHLYGYHWFPQYRIDVEKSIACCEKCHKAFHAWHILKYGFENRGRCTQEQFEEWSNIKRLNTYNYNGEIPMANLIICLETNEINTAKFFSEKYNNEDSHIYNCCNKKLKSIKGKHYLWYDNYMNMTNNDIDGYFEWALNDRCKKIICLNTLEIFNKMGDALKKYNINSPSLLTRCCKNKANYAGIDPKTGEKLRWMYLEDYLNKNKK